MAERNDPHQGLHQYICRFPGDLARIPKKQKKGPLQPHTGALTALAGAEVREQQEQVNDVHFAVAAEASARGEGGDFLQDLVASRRTYAHKKNPHKSAAPKGPPGGPMAVRDLASPSWCRGGEGAWLTY